MTNNDHRHEKCDTIREPFKNDLDDRQPTFVMRFLVIPQWYMAEGYAIVVLVTRTYGPVLPDLGNSIKILGFYACYLFIFYFGFVLL